MATNQKVKQRKQNTIAKENNFWLKEIERVKTMNIDGDFKDRLIKEHSKYIQLLV